jgi:hypothetical protein
MKIEHVPCRVSKPDTIPFSLKLHTGSPGQFAMAAIRMNEYILLTILVFRHSLVASVDG